MKHPELYLLTMLIIFIILTWQVMLLREALNIHNRKVSEELRPFHEHMETRFKEMVKLIHKEYNLNVGH